MAGNFRLGGGIGGALPVPGADRPTYVTWALLTINILLWLLTELAGSSEDPDTLLAFGAMFGPLIASGEYWRLFTAMFLHVGIWHLVFNNIGLLIFGRMVEQIFGHVRFTIIYVLAGLAGSVASFWLNNIAIGAGASGAIFGVLAALAAFLVARRHMLGEMGRQQLITIAIIGAANLVFGFIQPGIDNWAHMGGFAGGFVTGYFLSPNYRYQEIIGPFGHTTYRATDTNSLFKSWWIIPIVTVALLGGVYLGTESQPQSAISSIRSAEQHLQEGKYTDALVDLEDAIDIDSTNGMAYFYRGKIKLELGDNRGARSDLARAIRLPTTDSQSKQEAISLLVQLGSQ
jgi:rhomboid protease GluP